MKILGLDLGASTASFALWDGQKVSILPLEGSSSIPSVLTQDPMGKVQIGKAALLQSEQTPQGSYRSLMRLLGVRRSELSTLGLNRHRLFDLQEAPKQHFNALEKSDLRATEHKLNPEIWINDGYRALAPTQLIAEHLLRLYKMAQSKLQELGGNTVGYASLQDSASLDNAANGKEQSSSSAFASTASKATASSSAASASASSASSPSATSALGESSLSPDAYATESLNQVLSANGLPLDNACLNPNEKLYITCPNYFNVFQKQALKDAAALVGLSCEIISESTATILYFGHTLFSQLSKQQAHLNDCCVLMYNYSASKFECALVALNYRHTNRSHVLPELANTVVDYQGKGMLEILNSYSAPELGGDEITWSIVDLLVNDFKYRYQIDLSSSQEVMQRLFAACEEAKLTLSAERTTKILVPYVWQDKDKVYHLNVEFTREQLNKIYKAFIRKSFEVCLKCLAQEELSFDNISQIFLVGSVTQWPFLVDELKGLIRNNGTPFKSLEQHFAQELFGNIDRRNNASGYVPKFISFDPNMQVAACGAALYGALGFGLGLSDTLAVHDSRVGAVNETESELYSASQTLNNAAHNANGANGVNASNSTHNTNPRIREGAAYGVDQTSLANEASGLGAKGQGAQSQASQSESLQSSNFGVVKYKLASKADQLSKLNSQSYAQYQTDCGSLKLLESCPYSWSIGYAQDNAQKIIPAFVPLPVNVNQNLTVYEYSKEMFISNKSQGAYYKVESEVAEDGLVRGTVTVFLRQGNCLLGELSLPHVVLVSAERSDYIQNAWLFGKNSQSAVAKVKLQLSYLGGEKVWVSLTDQNNPRNTQEWLLPAQTLAPQENKRIKQDLWLNYLVQNRQQQLQEISSLSTQEMLSYMDHHPQVHKLAELYSKVSILGGSKLEQDAKSLNSLQSAYANGSNAYGANAKQVNVANAANATNANNANSANNATNVTEHNAANGTNDANDVIAAAQQLAARVGKVENSDNLELLGLLVDQSFASQLSSVLAQATVQLNTYHECNESLAQLKDLLQVALQEIKRVKQNSEQELSKTKKFAVESLLKDILPVFDALDQAVLFGREHKIDAAILQGQNQILELLSNVLQQHGVVVDDPTGKVFDPQFHQAVSMMVTTEVPPKHIAKTLQKGLILNQRVVRPAQVMVAKAPD